MHNAYYDKTACERFFIFFENFPTVFVDIHANTHVDTRTTTSNTGFFAYPIAINAFTIVM